MQLVECTAAMHTRAGLTFDQALSNPHVSLAYGHFDDNVKIDIVREIGGIEEFTGGRLSVSALVIYATAGNPRSGRCTVCLCLCLSASNYFRKK